MTWLFKQIYQFYFRLETDIPEPVLRETEQLKSISQMCSGERRVESTLNYTTNDTIKFYNKNQSCLEKKSITTNNIKL